MLNLEPGEKLPESPPKPRPEPKHQPNGMPTASTDYLPPFYQPPAPPPSQPLPDKPDTTGAAIVDSFTHTGLKRSETEKPQIPLSPTKSGHQDSQILPLLDALNLAKQELNSQSDRMKYLENALKRERKARESAERRARALSGEPTNSLALDEEVNDSFEPPLDSLELIEQDLPNGQIDTHDPLTHLSTSTSMETLKDTPTLPDHFSTDTADVSSRYDLLKLEFDQMKLTMETYKRKAEEAEASQRRFAELVESIRSDQMNPTITTSSGNPTSSSVTSNDSTLIGSDGPPSSDNTIVTEDPFLNNEGDKYRLWNSPHKPSQQKQTHLNGSLKGAQLPAELERSLGRVLEAQKLLDRQNTGAKWRESTPYVSMVGVVLIGVGIMTWLNGWPTPGEGGKVK